VERPSDAGSPLRRLQAPEYSPVTTRQGKLGHGAASGVHVDARSWHQRLARDERRVFVLDDDPTGTQTTSDTDVILVPGPAEYRRFVHDGRRGVHVLTNTRAIDRNAAVDLVRTIVADASQACSDNAVDGAFVLRGDSTLRGHVFAEVDALAEEGSVTLFVPALPEAGRVTIGGIHWMLASGATVPVSDTEFARDPVFGYESETVTGWVAEVGSGRAAVSLPLGRLRREGPDLVSSALLGLDDGAVLVPDAVSDSDLRAIAWGLLDAEQAGRRVVVRAAASFATTRYGGSERAVAHELLSPDARVLVVCGSHTEASTRQLEALREVTGRDWATLPTGAGQGLSAIEGVERKLLDDLVEHGVAVLATERTRAPDLHRRDDGAMVMASLMKVARVVAPRADVVISKGGITSAEVATTALSASRAHVVGQALAAVPVWRIETDDGHTSVQVVVPGNVGDDDTLVNLLEFVRPAVTYSDRRRYISR